MDQARWLVVFSVVVAMITTLSLLHRFSLTEVKPIQNNERPADKINAAALEKSRSANNPASPGKRPEKIRYSTPPAHVFSIENSSMFADEQRQMKDKGRIVE